MLEDFFSKTDRDVTITREQASEFAKNIANDFNPLHDVDSARFCVPGDLLFAVVLKEYGISEKMHFTFSEMVDEKSQLHLPEPSESFDITSKDKVMLSVERQGKHIATPELVSDMINSYVSFSGKAFPEIVIDVMKSHNAMISPSKPMIIYKSMSIQLDNLDISSVNLVPTEPEFIRQNKRGNITLRFDLLHEGQRVGRGEKHMIVLGVREYCETSIQELLNIYTSKKQKHEQEKQLS